MDAKAVAELNALEPDETKTKIGPVCRKTQRVRATTGTDAGQTNGRSVTRSHWNHCWEPKTPISCLDSGALGMGFSTIIILMLINGLCVCRDIRSIRKHVGAGIAVPLAACIAGFCWLFIFWQGESKTWLIIVASTFAAILLPIAYVSFFALMNNKQLLGLKSRKVLA